MTLSIPPILSAGSDMPLGSSSDMPPSPEATANIHDDGSDYGDFTLDEQEIINKLLLDAGPPSTIAEEPLELIDIEDYEEPKGVRLPKTLGKEQWSPPWMRQQSRAMVATQTTVAHQASHNLSIGNGNYASSVLGVFVLTC